MVVRPHVRRVVPDEILEDRDCLSEVARLAVLLSQREPRERVVRVVEQKGLEGGDAVHETRGGDPWGLNARELAFRAERSR